LNVAAGEEILIRWADTPGSAADQGLAVDDVSVAFNTLTCVPPSAVTTSNITSSTATVSFTGSASAANGYTVTTSPATTTQTLGAGATSVSFSGLTPSTSYTVSIVSNCSTTSASGAATASFTTLALAPTLAVSQGGTSYPSGGTAYGFGTQTVGATSSPASFTLTNSGPDALTIGSISATGDFAVSGTAPTTVPTGGTATVSVTFTPSTAGTRNGTLVITSNATTGATYTVNLTGNGQAATFPDLTVTTGTATAPTPITGNYNNVTFATGAYAALVGPLTVAGTLTVQNEAGMAQNCQLLSGAGSFNLQAGGTLAICDPGGISPTGVSTGAVLLTGTRTYSPGANYIYNGNAAQVTGAGLPGQVRSLSTLSANSLTLTAPVAVAQTVGVGGAGNLELNGNGLTLLSSATGTALVVNSSTGVVSGTTATMQRHIETNTGQSGYRHYSSPVQNETLGTLATTGYAPNFSGAAAYNSSPTPGMVTPFPTVYQYDQDRITTTTSNFSPFDKGYEAIASGSVAMEVGRGYTVNAPGAALVDFTGTLTTGNVARSSLNRTGVDGGWHLLGNPYPAPLDWSTLTLGAGQNLENLDGAVYVFQSSGPYAGSYRTYLASAPGSNSPLVPAGSGFFVHTTTPGTAGTLRLSNANRVTTFGTQPAFGRGTADTRPQLALSLQSGRTGLADEATLYAQAGATAGVDAAYDAVKLANPTGLNLALLTSAGEALALDGRPAFVAGTVVPLLMDVPAAGIYTLRTALANLPAGLTVYLRDAPTGQQVNLAAQSVLPVALTAGRSTRFSVVVGQNALATLPGLTASQVELYPNPSGLAASVRVTLPVPAGTREVRAMVLNTLGQQVGTALLAVQNGEAAGTLRTAGLAAGVYVVRLQAGHDVLSKRLVVN